MDIATVDKLLTTTRSVRKRLDLTRAVDPQLVAECLEIAVQAPTGSNLQGYHFVVVTDAAKRAALAELYRAAWTDYRAATAGQPPVWNVRDPRMARARLVRDSASYLAEQLHAVPMLIVACVDGRVEHAPAMMQASLYGSILPAVWSLMLALRARGVGSAWTTLHLMHEEQAAKILNIPAGVTQAALLPVAYFLGDDFTPAKRLAARERTDGVAVGAAELRVAGIELESVTALAVLGEGDGLEVRAGGGGLMAVGTGEGLAVALDEAGEVEGVVEAEGIGVGEFLGMELELGVVGVERFENASVAVLGPGNLEVLATDDLAVIKGGWRQLLAGLARGFHDDAAAVAGEALRVGGRGHPATALMLAVAGGAGVGAGDVGLVELVARMAGEAVVIQFRHAAGGGGGEAVGLEQIRLGPEGGAEPLVQAAVRGGVAGGAAVAAGPRVLHLRKDDAVVIGGNRAG